MPLLFSVLVTIPLEVDSYDFGFKSISVSGLRSFSESKGLGEFPLLE